MALTGGRESMIRLDFEDANEILDFLVNTSEFGTWETVICRLSAENGIKIPITTAYNDPLGLIDYLQLDHIKSTMKNFLDQNGHLNLNVEIKLKFPDAQRRIMDPNNYYNSFYFNLYSDSSSSFATTSFMETSSDLAPNPIVSWGVYITGLYNSWRKKNGK